MTYDSRVRPHQIRPTDDTGALVDPGVYGFEVATGGPFGNTIAGLIPVVSGLTSDDLSVSINDNGDGTYDLSAVAGPGGGGSGKDRRWAPGASETVIDEFNDDLLAAAWTRVDGTGAAAGNVAWTEGADSLSSRRIAANTSNTFQGIVRPISGSGAGGAVATGDAWVTCMTIFGPPTTSFLMGGLVISDGTTHGTGKQVIAELVAAGGSYVVQSYVVACSNWTTTGGTIGTAQNNPPIGTPTFLRLVYKGSNQWRADTSPNGVEWILGASLITLASFTPSHVGMYSRDASSGKICVCSYEFLRRVSGVA